MPVELCQLSLTIQVSPALLPEITVKKSDELRQERAKLVVDARKISAKATAEKRDMTGEESAEFNKIMDVSLGELDTQIKNIEADEGRMARLADEEARMKESQGRRSNPAALGEGHGAEKREHRYTLRNGRERVIRLQGARASTPYESAFSRSLARPMSQLSTDEQRALQADVDTTGGFLVAPQMFAARLIQAVDDMVVMRQLSNVLPPLTSGESIGIPTREADVADADWTTEIATGGEDSTLALGKRELSPHPIAKLVKISKKLIRAAALDPEAIVRERLAYKIALTQEKAFLTGTGAQQPLGVFTASTNGISTGRDVSTGNAATSIGADGLIEAKYTLKAQYQKSAQWLFHRDAVKQIAKLKDGDGQYLWKTGITGTEPDTLLGRPVNMSEYAPNTFTSGLYVGLLGDFSQYWIIDSLNFTIQVLLELYAATNQNGYIVRAETDGAPVLEEAFARVKLG